MRLVGPIVAIDDVNYKYAILTIDDGSGATICVKVVRRHLQDPDNPVDCLENTEVPNLNIISSLGVFEPALGPNLLDIGTVVKIKGTLEEYRGVKQIDLKRISIVKTTDEEVKAWAELAEFRTTVLSKPWNLSNREITKLRNDEADREKREKEHDRQRAERHRQKKARCAEYMEKKQQHDQKRDEWLANMEEKMSANALDRQRS